MLFAVVGLFGAYMAIDAHDDDNAWSRANARRSLERPTAGDAFARRDPPGSSTNALVASLEAQIASAHADATADADRLRLAPSMQRLARERHRTARPGEHAAGAAAMPTPSEPLAARRPATEAVSRQAKPSGAAVSAGTTPSAPPSAHRPAARAVSVPATPAEAAASASATPSAPAPAFRPATQAAARQATPAATTPTAAEPSASPASSSLSSSSSETPPAEPTTKPAVAEPREAAPSANAPVERTAPATSDIQPAPPSVSPLVSPTYRGASAVVKHRPASSGAQSANAKQGSRHAGRPLASNGTRRSLRPEATSRPPTTAFTLPHFFSTLLPPTFLPSLPKPPPPSFDLSDNQRELYRGH